MGESGEIEELQARLAESKPLAESKTIGDAPSVAQAPFEQLAKINLCQWSIDANDSFMACGGSRTQLPAGVYKLEVSQRGIHFLRVPVLTDSLVELEDNASTEIINGIRKFWASEAEFVKRGILFKRGILLWGPPGSGKTVTVSLLMSDLVSKDGIVFLASSPEVTSAALQQVRRIEPHRKLIVVLEDVDEIVRHHGEHTLLALLDGENQIANVVHIATTNYPENLGARIINRPSRFDEVRKIGMPNERARLLYLHAVLGDEIIGTELVRWVEDTDGLSIAHLRELVVATKCLGRTYEETLDRLKKMAIVPKSGNDGLNRPGFAGISTKEAYRVALYTQEPASGH